MKNNTLLRVEHLKKYFPVRKGIFSSLGGGKSVYVRAVDDVSFMLSEREILGFVGESGCGKSTMSRTILRLTEPTDGKIQFKGTDITSLSKKEFLRYRPKMQMIFQDPFGSLNPRRTVADTLRQTIKIHNLAAGNKSKEASLIQKTLEEVELKPHDEFWDKYPALLSGGQLQRVSIGRVLVLQPSFVIADEPISMLDVSVRIGILDLMLRMRDKYGISFIYITHDLVTARYICDRIAIMYLAKSLIPRGRMIYDTKIFLFYFRLSPDGRRLLFGGRPKSPRLSTRENAAHMYRDMLRVYPQLKNIGIDHAWSGKLGFTLDRSPHIGRHDNLHYAMGYCGHGVALATCLGEKIAEMVQGKQSNTAFADLPFKAIPFYSGNPWFRPFVYAYFSLMDRWA